MRARIDFRQKRVGVSRLEKGHSDAWNRTAYSSDIDASWCNSNMAAQQKLGLWSERRAWIDCSNPAHPTALGISPLITNAETDVWSRSDLFGY